MTLAKAARRPGWVLLLLAPAAMAQSWNEIGNAGNLPATAQAALGSGPLLQINGRINDPTDPLGAGNDRDMYRIHIYDPVNFDATTTGGTTLDTQLFLFTTSGMGISFNDDSPLGGLQSRLTGVFVPAPGDYLLAVSRYDRDATAGGLEIWADTPFNVERQPDGPGAVSPIDGWNGLAASALTGNYTITMHGASFVCNGFSEDFEGVAASPAGTILTGQAGYYIPAGTTSVNFLAFPYIGNALGVPQNPQGGSQFIGVTGPGGGAFGRAQKDITYPASGNVTISFDVCASFLGTLPSAQNLGSVSMQPSSGARSLIALARWTDPTTCTNWNADFVWYNAAGTSLTEALPNPSFQGLAVNHWYQWAVDVSLTTNQVLQVRLTDLITQVTVSYNPAGRYLFGGTAGSAAPTAFRWFSGGSVAGNTLAFDNMCIQPLPRQDGWFTPPQVVPLASVAGADDWNPALTPDELHMIFTSNRPGGLGNYDLWETWRPSVGGPWAPPVPVAWANTAGPDYEVNLVHDGTGINNYEMNWIRVGAASEVWTAKVLILPGGPAVMLTPPVLAPGVNVPGWWNDDPNVTDDGLTMFLTSDGGGAAGGGADIYTSTRPIIGAPWTPPVPFAPANTASLDHSPTPEANGRIVWFSSTRPGGSGGSSDIYVTYLDANTGTWSPALQARELNTSSWESNMWRRGITGRFYRSSFVAGGGRIFVSCYQAPSMALWAPGNPLSSVVMVDQVIPLAVPQPWELSQLFHRRWQLPIGSTVVVENFDWRTTGGWNFLLFSAAPVGACQPLLPGLEVGNFMLDLTFVYTHALGVGDPEGRSGISVSVPPNPLLSGLVFTMQNMLINLAAAPGQPALFWSEPALVLIL